MTNKHAGEVSLTLDGKEFVLKPTSNAMAIAEEFTGRPVFDLEYVGVRDARGILFPLMRGQHDVRTIDDVGALMDSDLEGAIRGALEAIKVFFQMTGKVGKANA